jgi:hypothetical protein
MKKLVTSTTRSLTLNASSHKIFPALLAVLALPSPLSCAEKMRVKIIDRRDSATSYSYVVPGRSHTDASATVNCYGSSDVSCTGSGHSNTSEMPAHTTEYSVSGATLALLLPDGRVAVVNCESKYSPKFDYINRRSCRLPLVNEIDVEFHGSKAKLEWSVSLDGKKYASETYKIIAVVKPEDSPSTVQTTKAASGG